MQLSAVDVDVAVIGCGTTGLTLTHLLADAGVTVAAVERWHVPCSFPRATHIDAETMRVFQTLGLAHMEKDYIGVGVYRFLDPHGRIVMEFDMNLGMTEQGWNSDYMFHQPDWESVMRGLVYQSDSATTFYGWELLDLDEGAEDAVAVKLRNVSTGQEKEISARYVVGCDGANSKVRRIIGSGFTDFEATHRSLILDIEPYVQSENLPDNLDSFIIGGIRNPLTYLSIAKGGLRIEEMLRPEDDPAEFESLPHIYDVLSPYFKPSEYRLWRADVYEWKAHVYHPWRAGRVFIAGDACHTTPPHIGQGMCSGIRDATNLAWKLPLVLRGDASPDLLDTYESERVPHVTPMIQTAAFMANQIEEMEEVPAEMEPPPPEARKAMRPRMGPGAFNSDDELGGTLSAQPRLADGTRMDDAVGFAFALVGTEAALAGVVPVAESLWTDLGVRVIAQSSGEVGAWLDELGVGAVLVRPDRYIFGTADSPEDVDSLLNALRATVQIGVTR
jgi:3-(3-hydroxy-phenyl)propionate hydroxylase